MIGGSKNAAENTFQEYMKIVDSIYGIVFLVHIFSYLIIYLLPTIQLYMSSSPTYNIAYTSTPWKIIFHRYCFSIQQKRWFNCDVAHEFETFGSQETSHISSQSLTKEWDESERNRNVRETTIIYYNTNTILELQRMPLLTLTRIKLKLKIMKSKLQFVCERANNGKTAFVFFI